MISLVDAVKAIDLLLDGKDTKDKEVFYSQGSMIKLINKFIVTPTIIVSNSVKDSKVIKDVIEHNVSLFASLYSQVFVTLVHIHGLKPAVAFELLSSNYETFYGRIPGSEDATYDDLLLGLEDDTFAFLPGLESASGKSKKDKMKKRKSGAAIKTPKENISKLITREIEISLTVDKKTIVIPAVIRANIVYTNFKNIDNMLTKDSEESFLDRIDDYRAGAITLGDLIFANDLIMDYKKRRIKDREDLMREIRLRELNSVSKFSKHGVSGYSRLYQMIILGADDIVKIEKRLRGSMHKDRVKESFLNSTSSLTATVIDNDYERVVMFINDLKGSIDLSFNEVSGQTKKSDSMEELLKVLMTTRTI